MLSAIYFLIQDAVDILCIQNKTDAFSKFYQYDRKADKPANKLANKPDNI